MKQLIVELGKQFFIVDYDYLWIDGFRFFLCFQFSAVKCNIQLNEKFYM